MPDATAGGSSFRRPMTTLRMRWGPGHPPARLDSHPERGLLHPGPHPHPAAPAACPNTPAATALARHLDVGGHEREDHPVDVRPVETEPVAGHALASGTQLLGHPLAGPVGH